MNGYRPVILRIFNAYGPGQTRSYAGVVEEFKRRIKAGKPLVIYGDGLQQGTSYTYQMWLKPS